MRGGASQLNIAPREIFFIEEIILGGSLSLRGELRVVLVIFSPWGGWAGGGGIYSENYV